MKEFTFKIIMAMLLFVGAALAESVDSLVVAFSNPSQPGTVKAEMVMGSIKVRTHSGRDVLILSKEDESIKRLVVPEVKFDSDVFLKVENKNSKNKPDPEKTKGLQRIQSSQFGINVEEHDNIVEINTPPMALMNGDGNQLEIVVPSQTSLKLKSMTGTINIDNVTGEIEVEAMGGGIKMNGVGGTIVAHTMGDIEATVAHVENNKPMSFSTFGGDIDVALPSNIKATFKLKSHGDIYTDFDTSKRKLSKNVAEDKSEDHYEAKIEKVLEIPVNGGGQDIEMTNFSGSIYIRKIK